jgi:hypothetical protein
MLASPPGSGKITDLMPGALSRSVVRLTVHPPERRRRSTILAAAACSCCCCCCLHSVGGLAGALRGGFGGRRPPQEGLSPEEAQRDAQVVRGAERRAIKAYWWSTLIVVGISLGAGAVESGIGEAWVGALVLAMALPAGQLVASVLTLIYLNVFPPERKDAALRRLGRITLMAFLWGLVGGLIMVPFLALLK